MGDVTLILERAQAGDPKAAEELLPLVYEELRKLAAAKMANEAAGQTLQPTALVNEAFVRLVDLRDAHWENRSRFFALSARLMRQILVDAARARRGQKRACGLVMDRLFPQPVKRRGIPVTTAPESP